MDGKCYPKQSTLAAELDCTSRQIRRLIKKLEQKGFIEVERPGLVERHIFKQSCHYFFLWHPVYETFMSAEMFGEKAPGSFYINQQILKAPAAPTGFENLCNQIDRYPTRFNPAAFIGKYIKLFPADAVREALQALLKKLSSGVDKCFEVWGYAIAVIKRIGPNYNEAEHIRESRQFKEELPTFEELEAAMIEGHIAEDDVEIQEPEYQEPVPSLEELRAMLYEEKEKKPNYQISSHKSGLDIEQAKTRINNHQTRFDLTSFIDVYQKDYHTDDIAKVLHKVADKMDMATGVDKILLAKFNFWEYAVGLLKQIKSQGIPDPKPEISFSKTDMDQAKARINNHQTQFNMSAFINVYQKKYHSEDIARVLHKIADKMDAAADVDKVILLKFDFWRYGSNLINQMKVRDYDKLEEKRIREELSQQKRTPEYKPWLKGQAWGSNL